MSGTPSSTKKDQAPAAEAEEKPEGQQRLESERPAPTPEERIAILETKVEGLERPSGWTSQAKTAALVLGVLGALVALPSGLFDLVRLLKGEQIRPAFSETLDVILDLDARVVTFGVDLEVVNDGERVALLTGASAVLRTDHRASLEIPFSLSDFHCSSDNEVFAFPFSVGGDESRPLRCDLRTTWDTRMSSVFSDKAARRLTLTLSSASRREYEHTFCFLEPVDLETWFVTHDGTLHIENTSCDLF